MAAFVGKNELSIRGRGGNSNSLILNNCSSNLSPAPLLALARFRRLRLFFFRLFTIASHAPLPGGALLLSHLTLSQRPQFFCLLRNIVVTGLTPRFTLFQVLLIFSGSFIVPFPLPIVFPMQP
jgi:hypothetical protein